MPNATPPRWNFYARNSAPAQGSEDKIALAVVNYDGPGEHSLLLDPDLTRCQLRQLVEDLAGTLVEYRRSYRQLDDRLMQVAQGHPVVPPSYAVTWTTGGPYVAPRQG